MAETLKFYEGGFNPDKKYTLYKTLEDGKFIYEYYKIIGNISEANHTHANLDVLDKITDDKIKEWDSKTGFSGDYNDLTNKPDIPNLTSDLINDSKFVTETEMDTAIINAKLSGSGEIDTSVFATKDELNNKSDIGHTHDYNDLTNKPTIPTLDGYAKKEELHSHSNKSTLDSITESKISEWNGKSNFSGDYNDLTNKPTIPSLDGYATETYVKNQIAEASLSGGGDVDLSGYATKDDLNNYATKSDLDLKANNTDLHYHSNKTTLDSITNSDITKWNNKSDFSGSYNDLTDKPTIPTLDGYVTKNDLNSYALKTDLHSHSNKTILDSITNSKISEWDNKSEFSGSYNDLTNKPTIPSKVSQLTNDSNFATTDEVKEEVNKNRVKTIAELKAALPKCGRIEIEGGEYILGQNEELEYYSNTELIGIGDVTIKASTESDSYIVLKPHLDGTETGYNGVHNFTMKNIVFDGQNSVKNIGLFSTAHCKNIEVRNCTFKNYDGRWHLVEINSSENVKMTNCDFTDYNYNLDSTDMFCTEAVQLDYAGNEGNYPFTCNLDNTGCTNITFEDCNFKRIKTSWTAAVGSHLVLEDNMPTNVTFTRCKFNDVDNCIYAPDYRNLVCDTCTAKNVANFVIVNPSSTKNRSSCKLDNCDYDGWKRYKKIGYMNDTEEGRFFFQLSPENEMTGFKITNNSIYNAYSHAIGMTPNCATVVGNTIKFSGKHGIYLYGGSQTSITANSCVGNGELDTSRYKDVYISTGSIGWVTRCNISGNSAYVSTSGETFENTLIQNNL